MQATNEPMRFVLPADVLSKARTTKYKRRWRGKDGKWQYEYETPQQEREHKAELERKNFAEIQTEMAAEITERYEDAKAMERLEELGSELYQIQAQSQTPRGGYEKDDAGLSLMDMRSWNNLGGVYSDRERLKQMRRILAKYKGQLGAKEEGEHFEEYVKLGLWDALRAQKEGDPGRIKPEPNRYGGVNLPLVGDRLKGAKWEQYRETMRKYKQHGLRFDGTDRAWYVRNVDLESFPWKEMQADLESFGIGMEEVPKLEKKPQQVAEEKHAGPVESGTDTATVIDAIQRRRVDDTVAVTVIEEGEHKGKYAFYSTFSRDWNDIFSNKSGVLSGITEYVPELGHARVTDNRHLVDEALERVAERMPNHTVIVGPEVKQKQDAENEALQEAQKPIPEVTKHLAQGVELFPFQNAGTRFLIEQNGNALIGDEMGLGKTMQTLAYAASQGKKVLVVCPRVVRKNWLREGTRFFPNYFQGRELKSTDLRKTGQPDLSGDNLVTVNYESLHKFLPAIEAAGFDTIVIDESHRMKNPKAKITKTLKALAPKMKHKILLSGTAIKNKKVELYEQLELIRPGMFSSARELKMSTHGSVAHKLTEVYLARLKREVLKDLPPKISSIVRMDIPLGELPDTPQDIGEISRAKADLAVAKTGATVEFVKEMLTSSDSSILVFSDSKEAANELKAKLGDVAVLHTGDTSEKAREAAVGHFDPSTRKPGDPVRVFVATTQSAGIGINLQTADKVVFNDLPWTPADLRQAEDRAWRIGTTDQVNVYWNTVEGHEFDELIADTIKRKYELAKKVLEKKQLTPAERKWMDEGISKEEMLARLKGKTPPGEPASASEPTESTKTQAEPTVKIPSQPEAPAEKPKMVIRPAALPQKEPKPPAQTYAQEKAEAKKPVKVAGTLEERAAEERDHVSTQAVPQSLRDAMDHLHREESQGKDPRNPFIQRGRADKMEIWFRGNVGRTVEGGKVEAVGQRAWRWRGGGEEITLTRDDKGNDELTYSSKAPDPTPGGEGPPPEGDKLSDHAAKVAAYNAKLEAKRDRLQERADKAKRESEARFKASDMSEEATGIPMGQPILVGHHSEKGHRKTIERAHANMGRAIAADKKAAELERRAEQVGTSGISSDDPEAATKIKEKLTTKEKARDTMKALNRAYKKHGQDWAAIQAATGVTDKTMAALKHGVETMPHYEKAPFPGYALTNLGAEIRRLKGRIGELEAAATRPAAAPISGPGYRIEEHPDDNRIRFYFDEKPPKEVTRQMRQAGFKWSPTEGAWQRHLNEAGRYHAARMGKQLFGDGPGQPAEAPQAPPETAPEPTPPPAPETPPAAVPGPEEGAHVAVEPKPEPKAEQTATPAPDAHAGPRVPKAKSKRQAKMESAGQLSLFKSRRPRFVITRDAFDAAMSRVDRLIKGGELNQAMDLIKAAGHKYLRRIPLAGGGKRKWRYVYSETATAMGAEHGEGEKIKLGHDGKLGHYEIETQHPGGWLTVKHDETGHYMTIHQDQLRAAFKLDNRARIDAAHTRLERTLDAARKHGTRQQQDRAKNQLAQYRQTWGIDVLEAPTVPKITVRNWPEIMRDAMPGQIEAMAAMDELSLKDALADLEGKIQASAKSPRGTPMAWMRWRTVVNTALGLRQQADERAKAAGEPTEEDEGMTLDAPTEPEPTPEPEKAPVPPPTPPQPPKLEPPPKQAKTPAPAAGLQRVGDHVWGSRKDKAEYRGKEITPELLASLSYQEGAQLVTKANLIEPHSLETLKGLGMSPGAAHMALYILSTIKAKPGDSAYERKAYVERGHHVLESVKNIKTARDAIELLREIHYEQMKAPDWTDVESLPSTSSNEAAFARIAELERENPGTKYKAFRSHYNRTISIKTKAAKPYDVLGSKFLAAAKRSGKGYGEARGSASTADDVHELEHMQQHFNVKDGWEFLEQRSAFKAKAAADKKAEIEALTKDAPGAKKLAEKGKTSRGFSMAQAYAGRELVRTGGKPVPSDANPERVQATFNLREIDYGNYLSQPDREHHTKQLEAALTDFADVLGIDPKTVSFKGRLAMALGARGGGRHLAHYEPGKHVINLTKFKGGGSLAHEWGHAFDNIIAKHFLEDKGVAAGQYLSDSPDSWSIPPDVREKVKAVMKAIKKHPNPERARKEHAAALEKARKEEHEETVQLRELKQERRDIKEKPATREIADDWIAKFESSVKGYEEGLKELEGKRNRDAETKRASMEYWLKNAQEKIATLKAPGALRTEKEAARLGDLDGEIRLQEAHVESAADNVKELRRIDPEASDYVKDAQTLGKYWTRPHELFARAFEAYVDDAMRAKKQQNTYLVKDTKDPVEAGFNMVTGKSAHPYPQGDDRDAITLAMGELMEAVIKDKHLEKAIRSLADARFVLRK